MKKHIAMSLLSSLCLTGCVPLYKLPDTSKTTTIDTTHVNGGSVRYRFCHAGRFYPFTLDAQGNKLVPYGKRITVNGTFYSDTDGTNHYTKCSPSISFIPKKGTKYNLDFRLDRKACRLSVLQYNSKARLGFDADRTVQKGQCYQVSRDEFSN